MCQRHQAYTFLLPPCMYPRVLECICVFLVTAMYALVLVRCLYWSEDVMQ